MAVISLISAKGAPGVTTTAVALAHNWPGAADREAVLFDAEPLGGGTGAGILRGAVPPGSGVLPLASDRTRSPLEAVAAASVNLDAAGRSRLIPGVPDASRAGALPIAWDRLRAAELPAGTDILVDAGRCDPRQPLPSWVAEADLVLVLSHLALPAVRATELLVGAWPGDGTSLRLLAVTPTGPYSASETAAALQVALLGQLSYDPRSAAIYSTGASPQRGHHRGGYARDIHHTALRCIAALPTNNREEAAHA
ncbi:MAG: hypothetical protein ACOYEV_06190 [Candidatus Nanopelagicales bacterium]